MSDAPVIYQRPSFRTMTDDDAPHRIAEHH